MTDDPHPELVRLVEVMRTLRRECPWDASQTHLSLVNYLIEETAEVVDAIETSDADLVEELGDLLLQVVFHAQIAAEEGRFNIEDVAQGISDKLVRRHPYVYADAQVPEDLDGSWERRKRAEKGRRSALDGIPDSLSTLARLGKVISRARSHEVAVGLATEPITADEVGQRIVELVARANASGVDADQAARAALRSLESEIARSED